MYQIYIENYEGASSPSEKKLLESSDMLATNEYRTILNPEVKNELNKAGSLEFTILPGNRYYNKFKILKTIATVYLDGEMIFRGRVMSMKDDIYKQRQVYCEGELAYLNDSLQPPYKNKTQKIANDDVAVYMRYLIEKHNQQMDTIRAIVNDYPQGEDDKHFAYGYNRTVSSGQGQSQSQTQASSILTFVGGGASQDSIIEAIKTALGGQGLTSFHDCTVSAGSWYYETKSKTLYVNAPSNSSTRTTLNAGGYESWYGGDDFGLQSPGQARYRQESNGEVVPADDTESGTEQSYTLTNPPFENTSFRKTIDAIQSDLIDTYGGYIAVHYVNQNGTMVRHIHYGEDPWNSSYEKLGASHNDPTSYISFGVNLQELERDRDGSDVYSVLLPTGESNLLTVNNVKPEAIATNSSVFVRPRGAILKYGPIAKTQSFSGIKDRGELAHYAKNYIAKTFKGEEQSFTIKAIDMHFMDPENNLILIGSKCRINLWPDEDSESRTIVRTCSSVTYALQNPQDNEYEFEDLTAEPKSLTSRYRKQRSGSGTNTTQTVDETTGETSEDLYVKAKGWIFLQPGDGSTDLTKKTISGPDVSQLLFPSAAKLSLKNFVIDGNTLTIGSQNSDVNTIMNGSLSVSNYLDVSPVLRVKAPSNSAAHHPSVDNFNALGGGAFDGSIFTEESVWATRNLYFGQTYSQRSDGTENISNPYHITTVGATGTKEESGSHTFRPVRFRICGTGDDEVLVDTNILGNENINFNIADLPWFQEQVASATVTVGHVIGAVIPVQVSYDSSEHKFKVPVTCILDTSTYDEREQVEVPDTVNLSGIDISGVIGTIQSGWAYAGGESDVWSRSSYNVTLAGQTIKQGTGQLDIDAEWFTRTIGNVTEKYDKYVYWKEVSNGNMTSSVWARLKINADDVYEVGQTDKLNDIVANPSNYFNDRWYYVDGSTDPNDIRGYATYTVKRNATILFTTSGHLSIDDNWTVSTDNGTTHYNKDIYWKIGQDAFAKLPIDADDVYQQGITDGSGAGSSSGFTLGQQSITLNSPTIDIPSGSITVSPDGTATASSSNYTSTKGLKVKVVSSITSTDGNRNETKNDYFYLPLKAMCSAGDNENEVRCAAYTLNNEGDYTRINSFSRVISLVHRGAEREVHYSDETNTGVGSYTIHVYARNGGADYAHLSVNVYPTEAKNGVKVVGPEWLTGGNKPDGYTYPTNPSVQFKTDAQDPRPAVPKIMTLVLAGTSWENHKKNVYLYPENTSATPVGQLIIDASTEYRQGVTDAKGSVGVDGSWTAFADLQNKTANTFAYEAQIASDPPETLASDNTTVSLSTGMWTNGEIAVYLKANNTPIGELDVGPISLHKDTFANDILPIIAKVNGVGIGSEIDLGVSKEWHKGYYGQLEEPSALTNSGYCEFKIDSDVVKYSQISGSITRPTFDWDSDNHIYKCVGDYVIGSVTEGTNNTPILALQSSGDPITIDPAYAIAYGIGLGKDEVGLGDISWTGATYKTNERSFSYATTGKSINNQNEYDTEIVEAGSWTTPEGSSIANAKYVYLRVKKHDENWPSQENRTNAYRLRYLFDATPRYYAGTNKVKISSDVSWENGIGTVSTTGRFDTYGNVSEHSISIELLSGTSASWSMEEGESNILLVPIYQKKGSSKLSTGANVRISTSTKNTVLVKTPSEANGTITVNKADNNQNGYAKVCGQQINVAVNKLTITPTVEWHKGSYGQLNEPTELTDAGYCAFLVDNTIVKYAQIRGSITRPTFDWDEEDHVYTCVGEYVKGSVTDGTGSTSILALQSSGDPIVINPEAAIAYGKQIGQSQIEVSGKWTAFTELASGKKHINTFVYQAQTTDEPPVLKGDPEDTTITLVKEWKTDTKKFRVNAQVNQLDIARIETGALSGSVSDPAFTWIKKKDNKDYYKYTYKLSGEVDEESTKLFDISNGTDDEPLVFTPTDAINYGKSCVSLSSTYEWKGDTENIEAYKNTFVVKTSGRTKESGTVNEDVAYLKVSVSDIILNVGNIVKQKDGGTTVDYKGYYDITKASGGLVTIEGKSTLSASVSETTVPLFLSEPTLSDFDWDDEQEQYTCTVEYELKDGSENNATTILSRSVQKTFSADKAIEYGVNSVEVESASITAGSLVYDGDTVTGTVTGKLDNGKSFTLTKVNFSEAYAAGKQGLNDYNGNTDFEFILKGAGYTNLSYYPLNLAEIYQAGVDSVTKIWVAKFTGSNSTPVRPNTTASGTAHASLSGYLYTGVKVHLNPPEPGRNDFVDWDTATSASVLRANNNRVHVWYKYDGLYQEGWIEERYLTINNIDSAVNSQWRWISPKNVGTVYDDKYKVEVFLKASGAVFWRGGRRKDIVTGSGNSEGRLFCKRPLEDGETTLEVRWRPNDTSTGVIEDGTIDKRYISSYGADPGGSQTEPDVKSVTVNSIWNSVKTISISISTKNGRPGESFTSEYRSEDRISTLVNNYRHIDVGYILNGPNSDGGYGTHLTSDYVKEITHTVMVTVEYAENIQDEIRWTTFSTKPSDYAYNAIVPQQQE